ncbi:MAG TPA: 1,4-dihydroxy-2-naphthoyl-CoA synthase [Xanthobacteraceae bacterium]
MQPRSFTDIRYDAKDGVARIVIDRPHAYNAFTTRTVEELVTAFEHAERDASVGVIVLTGAGDKAFCAGGDVKEAAGSGGYDREMDYWHSRLHHCMRSVSKPTIAAVNGYAIGGGHILHLLCDLTIACEEAKFGQAGPRVGSFDAGFGAAYLARAVGEKKAREIWFLCRQYSAREALEMGLVNKVVPRQQLDKEVDEWCREILAKSPFALKYLKKALNADTDHQWGFEEMAQSAVRLYWASEEAQEAKEAFAHKRAPDFSRFRR